MELPIPIDREKISAFCGRWKVVELSLFGSVLRDDFGPTSDVDVLVTFAADAEWGLWDLVEMRDELRELIGREVDLVERGALRNPFRERAILRERRVIHAAC
mgnify:CR=1 FL=1